MKKLKFAQDGKFVILQVSDPQDMVYARKAMLNMLDAAYDKVEPDLVVFTGDNILGNHILDARFGTRQVRGGKEETIRRLRLSLGNILKPLESREIPFAMIYGNHDDRNLATKDEQAELYKEYSCCVGFQHEDESVDCDTYNLPIYSSDGGKIAYNLWMLDSAWYDHEKDECFEAIKPSTVQWYKKQSKALKDQNNSKNIDSLLFTHIPLPKTIELLKECSPNEVGAVCKDGKWYRLDESKAHGTLSEYPSMLTDDNGLYDAVLEQGDVRALVFGHDHPNNFIGKIDDIDIVQTSCASFRCYGDRTRGVRVFVIDENDTSKYETSFLTYADLCGNSTRANLRYFLDADDLEPQRKILAIAGATILGSVGLAAIVKRKGCRR